MVLVDTGVWIDYFNGHSTPPADRLDALLSSTVVLVGDLILAEVLQGFRSDTGYRTAKKLLLAFEQRPLGGNDIALKAAANCRRLRRKGITVRKKVDCFIATYCIEHRIPLLYGDRDFAPFARHLGLRSALNS